MDLVEISKWAPGDNISRKELKQTYRNSYGANFNPRSRTEVRRGTTTRRSARAGGGSLAGSLLGAGAGLSLAGASMAASKGKRAKAAAEAAAKMTRRERRAASKYPARRAARMAEEAATMKDAIRGSRIAGTAAALGGAAGASLGRSANLRSGDVRATSRRSGKRATGVVAGGQPFTSSGLYVYPRG